VGDGRLGLLIEGDAQAGAFGDVGVRRRERLQIA